MEMKLAMSWENPWQFLVIAVSWQLGPLVYTWTVIGLGMLNYTVGLVMVQAGNRLARTSLEIKSATILESLLQFLLMAVL